ncbi:MAG: hypothetical protein QOH63_1382 [Acidobacteriota bacterium]|jgi:hypothetical protein|nr:hypothetical protein [Acidobacteriota bacterium]
MGKVTTRRKKESLTIHSHFLMAYIGLTCLSFPFNSAAL